MYMNTYFRSVANTSLIEIQILVHIHIVNLKQEVESLGEFDIAMGEGFR